MNVTQSGKYEQGQKNIDLVFILTVCPNGINLILKLDCHLLLLLLGQRYYLLSAPPPTKSVFGIHDPKGLSHLTQLRVGLSKLNFHKFQHNFRDTINPMCPSNDGIEDTEHFLLLCPSFGVQRTDLLAGIYTLLRPYGYANLANDVLLQILLHDDKNFPRFYT